MKSVVILFVFLVCARAAADGGALAGANTGLNLAEERSLPPLIKLPGQGAKP
jgi:hypothetical protein